MRKRVVDERFEILRRAAAGGMGTVYRAIDRRTGGEVALKLVSVADDDGRQRFVREARALESIRHENVVLYISHGFLPENHQAYLAMEWLPGETLAERLGRAELSPVDTIRVARQVASALGASHAVGVVHRDIKPSNVMLLEGEVGRVRLIDFGVARAAAENTITASGVLVGTPSYMSPEQARGESVEPASDIYSLGSLLYRCLAGKAPYAGLQVAIVLARVIENAPQAIQEVRPDLPASIVDLVERFMATDARDRPRNGRAAFAALGTVGDEVATLSAMSKGAPGAGLGDSEQRLMSIVCMRLPGAAEAGEFAETLHVSGTDQQVAEALTAMGLAPEMFDPGTLIVPIHSTGAASDMAERAAHASLVLRAFDPGCPIVVCTGRGFRTGATLSGDVRERAMELLGHASDGLILIDSLTARLLGTRFEVAADSSHYRLVAESEPVEPAESSDAHFVGRRRELTVLEATLQECVEEDVARAVVITGEPGVGKTRLVQELLRRSNQHRALIARADGFGQRVPFGLAADLTRRALHLPALATPALARDAVDRWVERHFDGFAADGARAFLGELLGATDPEGEAGVRLASARKDPVRLGDQLREAFISLIEGETRGGPLVIWVDDLQWGDPATVRCIDQTLGRLSERPLLVLGVGRPALQRVLPNPWKGHGALHLPVRELPRKVCAKLAHHALGPNVPQILLDRILDRAAGNALFLEELLAVSSTESNDALPESVLAMMEARLEGLSSPSRRVVRALSIYGRAAPAEAVRALIGDDIPLERSLRELIEVGLVKQGPGSDADAELAFRSDLVREAAYERLTMQDRKVGHGLAAAWLESHGELAALRLARHWQRAGNRERSMAAYERATIQALEAADWGAVVELADLALSFEPDPEQATRIEAAVLEAYAWSGRYEEMLEAADRLMKSVTPSSPVWSRVASVSASLGLLVGSQPVPLMKTLSLVRGIMAVPLSQDASGSEAFIHAFAVFHLVRSGNPQLAAPVIEKLRTCAGLSSDPATLAWHKFAEVYWSRFALRDSALARRCADASAELFKRAGHSRGHAVVSIEIVYESIALGLHDFAIRAGRETIEQTKYVPLFNMIARATTGLALARSGRPAESAEAFSSVSTASLRDAPGLHSYILVLRACAELAVERPGEALENASRALDHPGPPSLRAWATATQARALAALGRGEEAVEVAQKTLETIDQASPSDLAEVWVLGALPEALSAAGRHEHARREARRVLGIIEEHAKNIERPDWREAFLARPDNARVRELSEG